MRDRLTIAAVVVAFCAGCGGGTAGQPRATTATTSATSKGVSALQAEALSSAAGDIPDNQVFLVYRGPLYTLKYPEGWLRTVVGATVTFRDKNNIVRIVVNHGASARATIPGATHTSQPASVSLPEGRAIRVVYRTVSAPNPVTGKRITLTVDRYTLAGKAGRQAVVDLGTPVGVDNVDAYRTMIESFRWR